MSPSAAKSSPRRAKKVLYLDVDVHCGDGRRGLFLRTPRCYDYFASSEPKTLFPGTGFENEIGKDKGKGYCVNVPLPIGTYDDAYMLAIKTVVLGR